MITIHIEVNNIAHNTKNKIFHLETAISYTKHVLVTSQSFNVAQKVLNNKNNLKKY